MAPRTPRTRAKIRLNVVLGKSPGQTLRKFGHRAYTLESQKKLCISTFDYKYGAGRWTVNQWFTRDVSARVSKSWPVQLKDIIIDTQKVQGVLAAASEDRMLRTARDWIMVQDSKVPILICDDANLDTTTPAGKNNFGKKALDAEMEAEQCGERVKKALKVAKRRSKKLGTHHPKTKGKSARSQHKRAMQRARDLLPHVRALIRKGFGAWRMTEALNRNSKALKINGKKFKVGATQNVLSRLKKMRLI